MSRAERKLIPVEESLVLDTSSQNTPTRMSVRGKVFYKAAMTDDGRLQARALYGRVGQHEWAMSLHVRMLMYMLPEPSYTERWVCLLRVSAEEPKSEEEREEARMALLDALSAANGNIPVKVIGR